MNKKLKIIILFLFFFLRPSLTHGWTVQDTVEHVERWIQRGGIQQIICNQEFQSGLKRAYYVRLDERGNVINEGAVIHVFYRDGSTVLLWKEWRGEGIKKKIEAYRLTNSAWLVSAPGESLGLAAAFTNWLDVKGSYSLESDMRTIAVPAPPGSEKINARIEVHLNKKSAHDPDP